MSLTPILPLVAATRPTDPPGPAGAPLVGHALAFRRDPLAFLERCVAEHGDVVRIRLGRRTMVLLAHPDHAESVLVTNASQYRKPTFVRVMGKLLFGRALTASDGDAWRAQRRVVAPAFRPDRVDAYASAMSRHARRAVAAWRNGAIVDVERALLRLTIATSCETLLGVDAIDDGDADAIGAAVSRAIDGLGARVKLGLPTPDALPVPHNLRMRRGRRRIDQLVQRAIDARRRDGAHGPDLLSTLLAARDDRGAPPSDALLRDELATMLSVGAHQTALAIAWALHLVAQHPDVEARLHAEVDDALAQRPPALADVPRLRFASAIVDETLRLYPPFFLIAREAIADATFGGHRVRAGTDVGISPWLTHRDPRWFDAPAEFRPARWLDGLAKRLPKLAYMPFGGGPRVCVANRYSVLQILLAVVTIAQAHRLALAPGHRVTPLPSVALGMRDGLRMIVHRRDGGPRG